MICYWRNWGSLFWLLSLVNKKKIRNASRRKFGDKFISICEKKSNKEEGCKSQQLQEKGSRDKEAGKPGCLRESARKQADLEGQVSKKLKMRGVEASVNGKAECQGKHAQVLASIPKIKERRRKGKGIFF